MNRFLILVSLLIAAVACSTESTEPNVETSDPTPKNTVTLSAQLPTSTRVTTDTSSSSGWIFDWEEGDELGAWYSGCEALSYFYNESETGATEYFSGDLADDADYHRFIYPYSTDNSLIDGQYYTIDISKQSGELGKTFFINDAPLLTSEITSDATLSMKHLGGYMVVDVYLKNYVEDWSYTLTNVSYDGIPSKAQIDMMVDYESITYDNATNGLSVDVDAAFAEVEDGGAYYLQAITRLNILPFDVAADGGTLTLSLTVEINTGTTTHELTTSITLVNNGSASLPFAAATHNYNYLTVDASYGIEITGATINDWSTTVESGDLELTQSPDISYNTETATYEIKTANGLRAFSDLVNGSACSVSDLLVNDDSYFKFGSANTSINGKLLRDIDLGGIDADGNGVAECEFTPIGSSYQYKGTFDGGGYEVSGLYINQPSSKYQALFGYSQGATIKNLGVSGSVTGGDIVGGIIGFSNESTIERCYNTGSINGSSNSVGGIVGAVYLSTIEMCYNTGTINSTGNSVGGVVGTAQGTTISQCYNSGSIKSVSSVGGIVGNVSTYSSSTLCAINNCYNRGSVEGYNTVGGIAGVDVHETKTDVIVSNSYSTGVISGTESIGAIVGYKYTSSISARYCYYDEDVVGSIGAVKGSDDGTNYCGLTTTMMKSTAATEGSLLYYLTNAAYGDSSEWSVDSDDINDGYPILSWQTSNN